MRARTLISVLILACLSLLPAVPAAAMNWGVGTDLGLSIFMPSSDYAGADNITTFGWPLGGGAAQQLVGVPPAGGIRVSFADQNLINEIFLGTDLSYLSTSGSSLHQFAVTANYQYNFDMKGSVRPYVTAGLGLNMLGVTPDVGSGVSASAAVFGAGVGIAHWMGNGAGRLRAELHFDVQTEGKDGSDILLPKGSAFDVKLGFDLWDKK